MISFLNRRFGILSVDKKDKWWASGEVTLASNGKLTVRHNLGTTDVGLWVWPKEDLTFSDRNIMYQMNYINWPSVMPENLTLDFTQYNSGKFPNPVTVQPTSEYCRIANDNMSPTAGTTQWAAFNVAAASDEPMRRKYYIINPNYIQHNWHNFCKGTYKWIAIDLNKALSECPYSTGTITKTSAEKLSIDHNLNATQIILFAFPTDTVISTAGYQVYHFGRINFDALKPASIDLDFTPYSTGLTTVQKLTPSSNVCEITGMCSPWTTHTDWYRGTLSGQKNTITYSSNNAATTFNVGKATYKWIAIDLSEITG